MSLLNDISSFSKSDLKPTTTVVRTNSVITAEPRGLKKGHTSEEDIVEFQDRPEDLRKMVAQLAELVKASQHLVCYTGAGISTSADIPDYRGPEGAWTLQEKGLRLTKKFDLEAATPTYSHMALATLLQQGIVKHIVSTNLDGLHMRSGVDSEHLSELHGNCYKEKCSTCGTSYLRSFDVSKQPRMDHITGRKCEKEGCGSDLLDSIINFGEQLLKDEFSKAFEHSKKTDLALVCGTSMLVKPACELPSYSYSRNNGKMVIINKQRTPQDDMATTVIHGDIDDVFFLLLGELGIANAKCTPEGFPVKQPTLNLEAKYEEFHNKYKEMREERRRQNNPSVINSTLLNRSRQVTITNKQSEKQEIAVDDPKALLFISKCKGCEYTIPQKVTKVVIENCHHTIVRLKTFVITGYVECINSQDVTIYFDQHVPTITVDLSSGCQLHFATYNCMKNVYTAKCNNISICFAGWNDNQRYILPVDLEHLKEEEWNANQYITRKGADNKPFTEKIVRVGGGYVSTERENQIAEEKEKKNQQILEKMIEKLFTIENKSKQ